MILTRPSADFIEAFWQLGGRGILLCWGGSSVGHLVRSQSSDFVGCLLQAEQGRGEPFERREVCENRAHTPGTAHELQAVAPLS